MDAGRMSRLIAGISTHVSKAFSKELAIIIPFIHIT